MYKTISIPIETYQQLQALATSLQKAKAQVIADLMHFYQDAFAKTEQQERDRFHQMMMRRIRSLRLPPGTRIRSEDLDKSFDVLREVGM